MKKYLAKILCDNHRRGGHITLFFILIGRQNLPLMGGTTVTPTTSHLELPLMNITSFTQK
jgi:hypothetical protein